MVSMSLAPSGDAASPVKSGNIEDGGGWVSYDVSYFCREAADGFSGTEDSDRVTDGVRGEGDKDSKGCIFEDDSDNGAGTEDDKLDFGNRAVGEVTETRDEDINSNTFEDDYDDRWSESLGHETEMLKTTPLKMAVTTEQKPKRHIRFWRRNSRWNHWDMWRKRQMWPFEDSSNDETGVTTGLKVAAGNGEARWQMACGETEQGLCLQRRQYWR